MDEEENFARLLSASSPAPKPQWGAADDSATADPWANPFADTDTASGWGEPGISTFQPPPSAASAPAAESPEQSVHDLPPDPPSVIAARERAELEGTGGFGSGGFGGGFDDDPYAPSPFETPTARSPTKSPEPAAFSEATPAVPHKHIPAGLIDEELLNESDPSVSLKKAFVKHNIPAGTSSNPATPDKKYVFKPKDKPVLPALPPAKKDVNPASIPLPESTAGTPTTSRPETPTLSTDRVNISPLETPTGETEKDFGFQSLAIGSSGLNINGGSSSPIANKFGGRGWGAIEADDTPLSGSGDPWNEGGSGGWNNDSAGKEESDDDSEDNAPLRASAGRTGSGDSGSSPDRRNKRINTPMFQVTVSDPTKVGDPVRGHVVYTVKTKTTSPHYRRGDFSVLRRYSDFLWLFEQLCANNPGVIVPPIPDKHPFGRFQDQFIETRRAALQRALGKMTSHPILQLDPDLRLFLESESFALDIKSRRSQTPESTSSGLLSSWTGPKYTEQDDWFEQRKAYLDHLETQLKGISKSLDVASKARLDMADSLGAFADSTFALSESDLGAAMCTAFKKLSDLVRREKETNEDQAKDDVSKLLNLSDEYIRFIQSVRLAFASRVKSYHYWQSCEKEVNKVRSTREKQRLAGRAGGSGHEIGEVSKQLELLCSGG